MWGITVHRAGLQRMIQCLDLVGELVQTSQQEVAVAVCDGSLFHPRAYPVEDGLLG